MAGRDQNSDTSSPSAYGYYTSKGAALLLQATKTYNNPLASVYASGDFENQAHSNSEAQGNDPSTSYSESYDNYQAGEYVLPNLGYDTIPVAGASSFSNESAHQNPVSAHDEARSGVNISLLNKPLLSILSSLVEKKAADQSNATASDMPSRALEKTHRDPRKILSLVESLDKYARNSSKMIQQSASDKSIPGLGLAGHEANNKSVQSVHQSNQDDAPNLRAQVKGETSKFYEEQNAKIRDFDNELKTMSLISEHLQALKSTLKSAGQTQLPPAILEELKMLTSTDHASSSSSPQQGVPSSSQQGIPVIQASLSQPQYGEHRSQLPESVPQEPYAQSLPHDYHQHPEHQGNDQESSQPSSAYDYYSQYRDADKETPQWYRPDLPSPSSSQQPPPHLEHAQQPLPHPQHAQTYAQGHYEPDSFPPPSYSSIAQGDLRQVQPGYSTQPPGFPADVSSLPPDQHYLPAQQTFRLDQPPPPIKPGYVNSSGYSSQPVHSNHSEQPNQTGYPNRQIQPRLSEHQNPIGGAHEPGHSSQRGYQNQSRYGNRPEYLSQPGYTDQSNYSNVPGPSNHSGYPNEPEYPNQGERSYPYEPEYPLERGYLDEPRYPDELGYSCVPRYPNEPDYTYEPGFASEPGHPNKPGYPNQLGYSREPGHPNKPGYPRQLGYPSEDYARHSATSNRRGYPNQPSDYSRPPGYHPDQRDNHIDTRDYQDSRDDSNDPRYNYHDSRDYHQDPRDIREDPRDIREDPRDIREDPRDIRQKYRDNRHPTRGNCNDPRDNRSNPRDNHSNLRDHNLNPRDHRLNPLDNRFNSRDNRSNPRDNRPNPRDNRSIQWNNRLDQWGNRPNPRDNRPNLRDNRPNPRDNRPDPRSYRSSLPDHESDLLGNQSERRGFRPEESFHERGKSAPRREDFPLNRGLSMHQDKQIRNQQGIGPPVQKEAKSVGLSTFSNEEKDKLQPSKSSEKFNLKIDDQEKRGNLTQNSQKIPPKDELKKDTDKENKNKSLVSSSVKNISDSNKQTQFAEKSTNEEKTTNLAHGVKETSPAENSSNKIDDAFALKKKEGLQIARSLWSDELMTAFEEKREAETIFLDTKIMKETNLRTIDPQEEKQIIINVKLFRAKFKSIFVREKNNLIEKYGIDRLKKIYEEEDSIKLKEIRENRRRKKLEERGDRFAGEVILTSGSLLGDFTPSEIIEKQMRQTSGSLLGDFDPSLVLPSLICPITGNLLDTIPPNLVGLGPNMSGPVTNMGDCGLDLGDTGKGIRGRVSDMRVPVSCMGGPGRNRGDPRPNLDGPGLNIGGPGPSIGGYGPNLSRPGPNMGGPRPNMGRPNPNMGGHGPNIGGLHPNMGGPGPNMMDPGSNMGIRGTNITGHRPPLGPNINFVPNLGGRLENVRSGPMIQEGFGNLSSRIRDRLGRVGGAPLNGGPNERGLHSNSIDKGDNGKSKTTDKINNSVFSKCSAIPRSEPLIIGDISESVATPYGLGAFLSQLKKSVQASNTNLKDATGSVPSSTAEKSGSIHDGEEKRVHNGNGASEKADPAEEKSIVSPKDSHSNDVENEVKNSYEDVIIEENDSSEDRVIKRKRVRANLEKYDDSGDDHQTKKLRNVLENTSIDIKKQSEVESACTKGEEDDDDSNWEEIVLKMESLEENSNGNELSEEDEVKVEKVES